MTAEKITLVIPAVGDFRPWAEVTAESARRGSSLPVEVRYLDWTNVDRRRLEHLGAWHGSAIVWSRMFLAEIFPDLDWVVSCDADVMFRGDIAELWALRDDDAWVIGSEDCPFPGTDGEPTVKAWFVREGIERPKRPFCAGLALFNLKAMRAGDWAARRDAFLAAHVPAQIPYLEQTVMNALLGERLKLLPRQWGCFSGNENADIDWNRAGAVHFVDDAPWARTKPTHLLSDLVVEWRMLANAMGHDFALTGWRRWVYLWFKRNQWLLRCSHRLWCHFRSTRGLPRQTVNGMAVVEEFLRHGGWVAADETWVHGMWLPRYWLTSVVALVRGRRLVRMPHGALDPVRLGYHGWKKRLVSPVERCLLRRADRVVATCAAERDWILRFEPRVRRVEVIDLKRFFDLTRPLRPLTPGRLKVLYLGRRHPLKGLSVLERAAALVPDVVLRVETEAFGALKEGAFAWCDVLCLPSLSENFGLVVAEALAHGRRVMVTDGAPAWADLPPDAGIYLRGYREADDATRVRLLVSALRSLV